MTIQLSRRTVALAVAAFLAFAGLATASFVLTLTRTAEANDKFDDIATGTFFHDSTAWLKDNGIADGFNDGTFKPNDNITRGQASYWFANYNNAIEVVRDEYDPGIDTTFGLGVNCPFGKRAIAGGGSVRTPGRISSDVLMTSSYSELDRSIPISGGLSTWYVRWRAVDDTPIDPSSIQVEATCVPNTYP